MLNSVPLVFVVGTDVNLEQVLRGRGDGTLRAAVRPRGFAVIVPVHQQGVGRRRREVALRTLEGLGLATVCGLGGHLGA